MTDEQTDERSFVDVESLSRLKIEFVKKKILIYLNMRYRKLVIVPNVLLYINPGCSFPEDAAISICLNGKARSGNTFRH